MEAHSLSKIIKLGTAIRYLIDVTYKVQSGIQEPFGPDHVISNMEEVITIIEELKLESHKNRGPYKDFNNLLGVFRSLPPKRIYISSNEAKQLETVSRRLRDKFLGQGSVSNVYILTLEEQKRIRAGNLWPEFSSLGDWKAFLHNIPGKMWAVFFTLAFGIFVLGWQTPSSPHLAWVKEIACTLKNFDTKGACSEFKSQSPTERPAESPEEKSEDLNGRTSSSQGQNINVEEGEDVKTDL